jgi:hypothetical protein
MNTDFVPILENKLSKLQIDLPRTGQGNSVTVADFGARAEENFCNLEAFEKALQYCLGNKVSSLIVPTGNYHFLTKPFTQAHLNLDGFVDFSIEGQGSELIFHHTVPYISICNSQRIMVKDLFLDWDWSEKPLASVGVIECIGENGSYIDMYFPAYSEVSETMEIRFLCPFDTKRYTPGCKGGFEFRPYENNFILNTEDEKTDSDMQELVRELSNILKPNAKKVSSNILRFETKDPEWSRKYLKKGQCYNIRHYEYDNYAVYMYDSAHLSLENIVIYSCPGSGFVGNGDIHHIHLNGCKIQLKPGTARSITTTVDGLHICNSQGNFIIENCDFSYSGDDCINIHDNSSMGIRYIDSNTLLALRVRRNSVLYEKGYSVELRKPDLSPYGYSSELVGVEYDDDNHTCLLKFKDTLPKELSPNTVLFNGRFHTDNYIIRNCRFSNNRARAILLQGCNGIVEHNVFENIQGAAIQIETGCESRWSEGKGVRNLVIRKNRIHHCDLNAWQMAVIYMGVYLPEGRTDYPIFENILFEDNTICDCPRLALYLSSCKNVIVQNNTIINPNQIPLEIDCYGSSTMEKPIYNEHYAGTIQFEKATNYIETKNLIFTTL